MCRLILAAVLLISKFYNDVYYSNKFIGMSIGMPLKLLNEIERAFSKFINYTVFVGEEQYEWYLQGLHKHNAVE